jgi:hypothetical protein
MPLSELGEALARLEHKIDHLIRRQEKLEKALAFPLTPDITARLGEPTTCPICREPVKHQVDVLKKIIVRRCGCKTGLVPPLNLDALAPPALAPRKDQDHGELGQVSEDRRDPHSGGRSRRR